MEISVTISMQAGTSNAREFIKRVSDLADECMAVDVVDQSDDAPTPAATVNTGAGDPLSPPAEGELEFDTDGIPYDERIHTKARTKNKDGTWRNKRNITEKPEYEIVMAELRAKHGPAPRTPEAGTEPVTAPAAAAPQVAAAPAPTPQATLAPQVAATPQAAAPAPQVAAAPAPAEPVTFATLQQRVMTEGAANPMLIAKLQGALGEVGATQLGDLQAASQEVLDYVASKLSE